MATLVDVEILGFHLRAEFLELILIGVIGIYIGAKLGRGLPNRPTLWALADVCWNLVGFAAFATLAYSISVERIEQSHEQFVVLEERGLRQQLLSKGFLLADTHCKDGGIFALRARGQDQHANLICSLTKEVLRRLQSPNFSHIDAQEILRVAAPCIRNAACLVRVVDTVNLAKRYQAYYLQNRGILERNLAGETLRVLPWHFSFMLVFLIAYVFRLGKSFAELERARISRGNVSATSDAAECKLGIPNVLHAVEKQTSPQFRLSITAIACLATVGLLVGSKMASLGESRD